MKKIKFIKAPFFLLLLFFYANLNAEARGKTDTFPQVNKIVFMIGDGMGVAQIYAGYTANKGFLNLEKFKCIGFSITNSSSNYITESAAGATAFSIGEKTHNDAVGVDSANNPKPTILKIAKNHKLATGIVVTTDITDATPADFVAHVPSRKMQKEIADVFVNSAVDVFIGAGKEHFYNPEKKHAPWVNWQGGELQKNGLPDSANQPLTSFPSDFSKLPTVSFVIPNEGNDMHNIDIDGDTAAIKRGDKWLKDHLSAYVEWAKKNNSMLILTFDEDEGGSMIHNYIPTIFVGDKIKQGQDSSRINHYSVLRTVESMYNLPLSGKAKNAKLIQEIWK